MERNKFLKIRVNEAEAAAATKRAEELGTTVSDLIRQSAIKGNITVRATDSDAAFELRRLGAMLKSLYPKAANWTNDEKRAYWDAMNRLLGYADQLALPPLVEQEN